MSSAIVEGGERRPFLLNPLAWRRWWLAIDKNDTVIAFAQTLPGQMLIHAALLACLLMIPLLRTSHVALMAVALALCWAFPTRRLMVLAITGATYFLLRPFRAGEHYDYFEQLPIANVISGAPADVMLVPLGLVFLLFAFAMIRNQQHKHIAFIANRPLVFIFSLIAVLAFTSITLPNDHALFAPVWIALVYLASTFFFLGYVLIDQRSKTKVPLHTQLGFMRPFWAGFAPPIKGPAFYVKFQSQSDVDLAKSRLKGIKLAVWALILFLIWDLGFNKLIYGYWGFQKLDTLIKASAAGESIGLATRWSAVGIEFIATVIVMGASIHAVVSVIRVAGFCIPRGMVRPLESRTIAEFWGRYLFYFKEMLVDFFFYPTFRRYFKKSPRLRMAFATFAAAFVGNVLFDFIYMMPTAAFGDLTQMWQGFVSYCIYAGILTAGIIWSQLAQTPPKPEMGYFRYNVWPRVQVISFFALLQIVDDAFGKIPIGERLDYLVGLFGVSL